ncbi:MAG TPA: MFS transporter [Polyangiaceae bacterium]|nr:MFS transporter [Polyangiaceae bacterium]
MSALTSYQKKLFVFLSVATLFEGYDFIALTQLLPELRQAMNLSEAEGGRLVSFINIGTVVAFVLLRYADRLGRRRVLTITIAGYTAFTFLSGLAPGVIAFALCQFGARVFLTAEWAISMVYAAEEFPAERRGTVIGVIQGCSSLGSIVCAGLVPTLLQLPWGWRSVYFVGIVPLLLLAYARRGLKESRRFEQQVGQAAGKSFFHIWSTPYKRRVLQMAIVWGLTYLCTQNAVTFWKEFAISDRNFTDKQVALSITVAAVASMPLVFYAGKLLDQVGRRIGAVIIFSLAVVGVLGCYGFTGWWPLTGALVLGIFGASGVLPVLNAFTAELFPTELRGDAFAWSNNVLGRIGYVLSPAVVGVLAEQFGSWGPAVQLTVIGPAIALVLMLLWLPETKARELEETAAV